MSVTKTFSNSGQITVPYYGQANPSTINVSGVTGTVEKITVTLYGITSSYLGDWDVLLAGPGASKPSLYLMSDAGNNSASNNLNIIFDDDSVVTLPQEGTISSNTTYSYRPVNYYDVLGSAPNFYSLDGGNDLQASPPPGDSLAFFKNIDVNGSWTLNVQDDFSSYYTDYYPYFDTTWTHGTSEGFISGGWKIDITASGDPAVSVGDASVKEGDNGTTFLTFPVTLSSSSLGPITVNYSTANGTATAGADYTSANGSILFQAGETTKTVSVEILNDAKAETNENFTLNLQNPVGATIGDGKATGTIVDNDLSAPNISFVTNNYSITEGDKFTTFFLPVRLSKTSKQAVRINYTAFPGEAKSGKDYNLSAGTLIFAPGQTQKNILVTIVGDTLPEQLKESFSVRLSSPVNANIDKPADALTKFNILDNDKTEITINDISVVEGTFGAKTANFTVSLSKISEQPAQVFYSTQNGSALGFQDFIPIYSSITIPAGQKTGAIRIPIKVDNLDEDNEKFSVNLTKVTTKANATIKDKTGTATIIDDDAIPQISISSTTLVEGNAGQRVARLNVNLSNPSEQTIKVRYRTINSTAAGYQDYQPVSKTLTFFPNSTKQTINIYTYGDYIPEQTERFSVLLFAPTNAKLKNSTGTVTLINDDYKKSIVAQVDLTGGKNYEGSAGEPEGTALQAARFSDLALKEPQKLAISDSTIRDISLGSSSSVLLPDSNQPVAIGSPVSEFSGTQLFSPA